jgi:hypothetical protein
MQPEKIVHSDCTEWKLNGNRHRLDGPAIEHKNGTKLWYVNGHLHRLDGPARDYKCLCCSTDWYIYGFRIERPKEYKVLLAVMNHFRSKYHAA